MNSNTTCKRTLSIAESGMTTLRFSVEHDEQATVRLTLEEQLPDDVDLDTVAVGPSDGKWIVYDDGTVQWSVSVRPNEPAIGTVGVVCTDPDAVDALADDSSSHIIVGDPPAPPSAGVDDVDTIEPASLESATATERVPEGVYERIRRIDDREFETDFPVQPTASSNSNSGPVAADGARSETATWGSDPETGTAATDVVRSGNDDESAPGTADAEWPGDPLENALRVQDQESRADETAYRFMLTFDDDDVGNDPALEVLEGLLNGTTVFGADPPLPDIEAGMDPNDLTVTISSALDEDALVGALEDVEHASVACFETLDVDLTASEPEQSNADEQFREVDQSTEQTGYEEIEDEVDDLETNQFDFGDEPVSFADLVEDPEGAHEAVADSERDDQDDGDDGAVDQERVTERLLNELDDGGVTEHERIELRRRLGVDPRTSTEARLDHLHARVDELSAYTGALESFLDEEGTARTLLSNLTEDITELASKTDELDDRVETEASTAATERESIEAQLTELGEAQDAERERIDDLAETVESNSSDVDDLANDVNVELETLRESVESLETMASKLDDRLADVEDTLETLEDTVDENSRVREKLKSLAN